MKRKSLLIMLLVTLCVPLAMNAQTKTLKKSANGLPKLEVKVPAKAMPSNPMLSKLESAKEAALEELNGRGTRADNELLTEGFENMSSISTSYSATGWYAYNAGSGNNWTLNSSSTYANSGSKSAQVQFSSSYAANCYLVSAPFTVSSNMSELTVGLYERVRSASYPETFEVFFVKANDVTSAAGVASATKYNAIASASYTNTSFAQKTGSVTNSALAGQSVRVVVHCTSEADKYYLYIDDITVTETVEETCPKPTDLNATNLTLSSATVSWTGEADSYTLQYRIPASDGEAVFSDDFEAASLNTWDWTTYTNGDAFSGFGWFAYNPQDLTTNFPTAYSGSTCAISLSYGSAALNADNYLVTPQVALGGTLKFYIMSNYSDEYEVLLSTRGNAVDNFTTTLKAMSAAPSSWTEVSIDLSAYAGQQGYIAIHHVFYDGWGLFLDDFGIYGEAQPASPWVTINNATSPYTITGLDGETTYEWQVQGDCGSDGLSLWSSIATFTTPSACGTPTGLTTTDITNNSATLSWTEVLDAYNVRYRKGFVYDFESAEPWTYTDFTPCTTYDGDGESTYGLSGYTFPNQYYVGACIAFQNGINTNMVSHDGNAFGVMFNQAGATNDWFILPEITVESGDVFSFWIREITTQYGDEIVNVGICGSTDGTFSSYLAQNAQISSTDWGELSYDLSSYAGQTIKLAINCVSNDVFGILIDDLFVGNPNNDWSTPVAVNGSSYALTSLDMDTYYTWQVQGVDCDGNGSTTSWASDYFTTLNGILVGSITADDVEVVVGGTATITPTVLPADATNPAVTYTSNDETIATVTSAGVVTGVAVGTTTITIAATDGSNVRTDINVTVNGIDVTGITAENVTVVNGETATISYTVAPTNATDQSVTFTVEDETIATVADGVVTGVSVGATTITITSVSNPEVTATITVTVTSNPNAVQFTVNAPANAAPGDVITVEAVLNAPTEGTYNGFTGLVVGLHFDPTVFAVNGNPVKGPVADAGMMATYSLPNETHPETVNYSVVMTPGNPNTTTGIVYTAQFTVLTEVESGSYTFYVEPTAANQFVYNPGSAPTPIPYEYVPSTVTIAALEQYFKEIGAYGTHGYYLIASPIGEVNPGNVDNMLTPKDGTANTYDLYSFNQAEQLEWRNYRQGAFEVLEPGKGYLYANLNDVELVFTGSAYSGSGEVTLSKTAADDGLEFPDWNLVGNPFAETAYIADGRDFYTMTGDGRSFVVSSVPSIEAMEGVFVIAATNNEKMYFTTTEPDNNGKSIVLNLGEGRQNIDRAIVRFGEGRTLPKLQFFEGSTKLYIPQDGKDYAVVRSEEMGAMPVNFKAENNGTYSLNVSGQNTEFAYLHLIDNKTGNDVDLLKTPSYSFEAKTTDYESRFKLVFATGDNSNDDSFAFFSNGSFVINNEGAAELQVIDLMGRILSSETINGCTNVNVNAAPGVYMLRLINGDNVKVQKVVVK